MSGFEATIESLRAGAAAIDTITDDSRARGLDLEAPEDLGNADVENAAVWFATGWNGAAIGMVRSSSSLSDGLRLSAATYVAVDIADEVLLKIGSLFGRGGTP